MKKLFGLLFCLFSLTLHAQGPEGELPEDELSLAEFETKTTDTIIASADLLREPLSLKDSILSLFEYHHESVLIDSLWRQELYASSLFEEMYEDILEFDAEEMVEYEALSTEVLKERLALLNAKTPFEVEYNPILESVIKTTLKIAGILCSAL